MSLLRINFDTGKLEPVPPAPEVRPGDVLQMNGYGYERYIVLAVRDGYAECYCPEHPERLNRYELRGIEAKKQQCICVYKTGETESTAGLMEKHLIAKKTAEIKAAAEKVKKDAENAETLEKFSHLERGHGHAIGAKNIRKELKTAFPGVKFSVRGKSFSGGNSISVHWTDGPTVKAVSAIVGKYEEGRFDGMEDIYKYNNSFFCENFGGTKYLHASRSVSTYDQVFEAMLAEFGGEDWQREQGANRETRKLLAETDLTGKGAFIRLEYDTEKHEFSGVWE